MKIERKSLNQLWRKMPFKLLLFVVIFMSLVKEWYPFSHFPMYSSFAPHTYYVYVTDGADHPIAIQSSFGIRTSNLKKIYANEVKKIEKRIGKHRDKLSAEELESAGVYTLRFLRENSKSKAETDQIRQLELHLTRLVREKNHISRENSLIARLKQ